MSGWYCDDVTDAPACQCPNHHRQRDRIEARLEVHLAQFLFPYRLSEIILLYKITFFFHIFFWLNSLKLVSLSNYIFQVYFSQRFKIDVKLCVCSDVFGLSEWFVIEPIINADSSLLRPRLTPFIGPRSNLRDKLEIKNKFKKGGHRLDSEEENKDRIDSGNRPRLGSAYSTLFINEATNNTVFFPNIVKSPRSQRKPAKK